MSQARSTMPAAWKKHFKSIFHQGSGEESAEAVSGITVVLYAMTLDEKHMLQQVKGLK